MSMNARAAWLLEVTAPSGVDRFRLRLTRGERVVFARRVAVPPAYDDRRPTLALLEAAVARVPWLEGVSFDAPETILAPLDEGLDQGAV